MDYAGFGPFAAIQISWLTLAVWILASTSAAFLASNSCAFLSFVLQGS